MFYFILRFITLYSLLVHLPLDRCTITWGGETIAMVARQMERPGKGNIPYHKRFWVHWRLGVLPCWSTNAPVQVRLNQTVFGFKKMTISDSWGLSYRNPNYSWNTHDFSINCGPLGKWMDGWGTFILWRTRTFFRNELIKWIIIYISVVYTSVSQLVTGKQFTRPHRIGIINRIKIICTRILHANIYLD